MSRSIEEQLEQLQNENAKLKSELSELKKTESALRVADERIRQIHQMAPLAMISYDSDCKVLEWNPSAELIFGYTQEEMIGNSVYMIVPEDETPGVAEVIRKAMKGTGGERYFNENITKDGRRILCQWHNRQLTGENGVALGTASFAQDITEETLAKNSLKDSEERLKLIYDSTKDGIWDWDIINNKVYWSARMYNLLGYKENEFDLNFESVNALRPEEDRAPFNEALELHLKTGEEYDQEFRMFHKDGTIRWFHTRGRAIRDQNNEPTRMIGLATEITHRKQVEAQLRALIDQLEEKNAELERFTYTVSHELKSPLVTINGFLGMLETDVADNNQEAIAEDCYEITSAVNKMRSLLSDLLDLSRLGRISYPHQTIELDVLVEESLTLLRHQIADFNIDVQVQSDLPAFYGDKIRWQQTVHNFIENAIKYRSEDAPYIRIGTREEAGRQFFFVEDNGIGIAPEYHSRVFRLFEQLNPTKEGTGIGLAIVQRIAELQKLELKVESDGLGKGSCFLISLPENQ